MLRGINEVMVVRLSDGIETRRMKLRLLNITDLAAVYRQFSDRDMYRKPCRNTDEEQVCLTLMRQEWRYIE